MAVRTRWSPHAERSQGQVAEGKVIIPFVVIGLRRPLLAHGAEFVAWAMEIVDRGAQDRAIRSGLHDLSQRISQRGFARRRAAVDANSRRVSELEAGDPVHDWPQRVHRL
jgi:hypothetical protein